MANSFGPSGAKGTDPVSKAITDALPKDVVQKVIDSSRQISQAMKLVATNVSLAAKKTAQAQKDQAREIEYDLRKRAAAEEKYRRDYAKLEEKEAQKEIKFRKDYAKLVAEEAAKEEKFKKDYAKLVEKENEAERKFRQEFEKLLREENAAQENATRRLQAQRSAALNKEADQQDSAAKALEAQRSKAIGKEIDQQEAAARKLDAQRSAALNKEISEQEAAARSLAAQRSRAIAKQLEEEDKARRRSDQEKIDKLRSEEEYRMGGMGRLMDAVNGVVEAFKKFTGLLSTATKFVAAFNPALIFQLGMVFKDLYATIGYALTPVVEGMIDGIRTLADVLVPVAKEFAPVLLELTNAFKEIFVGLIPYIRDFLSVILLAVKYVVLFAKVIAILIDPIIMALTGFAVILVVQAIPAVIAFATSIMTMSALMTAGLSLVIGGLASLAFSFLRATGIFKGVEFKPGVSAGMGARQASYTGITEFGKNLLAQGLGSTSSAAATQTANNTKRCADLLDQIANGKGGGFQKAAMGIMFGGPGVKVERVGGKDNPKSGMGKFLGFLMGL